MMHGPAVVAVVVTVVAGLRLTGAGILLQPERQPVLENNNIIFYFFNKLFNDDLASVLLIKMLEEVWSVIILTRRGAVLLHGVVLTLVNNLIN